MPFPWTRIPPKAISPFKSASEAMEWFGSGTQLPLIVIRAIHFAATAVMAGSLIFRAVVAEPALRATPGATTVIRPQILLVTWIGFVIAAASGVIWLQLEATSMSGRSF